MNRIQGIMIYQEDLIYRLEERARIRRQIKTRKSVQEGQPDRIADLLEEAANTLRLYGHVDTSKTANDLTDWCSKNGYQLVRYCRNDIAIN